jgi:hypothetical protein
MIDSCQRIRNENLHPNLGRAIGFAEVDWVYCLNRARPFSFAPSPAFDTRPASVYLNASPWIRGGIANQRFKCDMPQNSFEGDFDKILSQIQMCVRISNLHPEAGAFTIAWGKEE